MSAMNHKNHVMIKIKEICFCRTFEGGVKNHIILQRQISMTNLLYY